MNNIFSGKYLLPFSVLALVVLIAGGVFVWSQLNQTPAEPEPQPTPGPSSQLENSEVVMKTLSLENWEPFDGEAEGLKRGITFLYPSGWDNFGIVGSGAGASGLFFEIDKNTFVWNSADGKTKTIVDSDGLVGYLGVHSPGQIYTQTEEFIVLRESPISVDGYEGKVVHRSVTLVDGSQRKEWWLILPNVEGSLGTNVVYEFYMTDIYQNSEEVFGKIVESIQIEDYETFKLKP